MTAEAPLLPALRKWLLDNLRYEGYRGTLRWLIAGIWGFLRDSTPTRRRQRYGDMEYDWNFRVDTTSGTVGWRERLLGEFHSAYQPTDPAAFREMLASLAIDYSKFTFIDLGSGKGRTLLMAAEYPFRRILGVELLPALHQIAQENIKKFQSPEQRCLAIEALCADARAFQFPDEPTLLYLFNPLPESGLIEVVHNLETSLGQHPREVFIVYHNPLLRHVLEDCSQLRVVSESTDQFVVYANR
jgi:SAM-dependent methyltransferase